MSKRLKSKIFWFSIPAFALLAAITISGYFHSRAEQLDAYQLNGNVLLGYNGLEETVTIPEQVSVIGSGAFEDNQIVKKVIIPEGVTEIGQGAFRGCGKLTEIVIPDSVTVIDDSAFDGCQYLESVSIGNGLSELGNGVFSDCDALKEISFANNTSYKCQNGVLTDIDETQLYQFLAGNGISSYKMPDTMIEIKPYAFWGCDNLKRVDFSSGLSRIDAYAAAECSGLETVVLREPTREIGMGAFANDISLKEIVLPVSITSIHDSAFTAVSKDLRIICQEGSFAENYAVNQGYTPDISDEVPAISTVTASLQEESALVEEETADGSESAEISHDAAADSELGNIMDNSLYNELGNSIIVSDRAFVMMDSPTEWKFTNETEEAAEDSDTGFHMIQDYEYYQNLEISSLSDIIIPETVSEIGKFAFARSGIESADIPKGIKAIGYGAFYHADQLTKVEIPDTVTFIDAYAFYYTPWYETWKNDSKEEFLIVGDGILLSYKGAAQSVIIPEHVKYISSHAFLDNQNIQEVLLPDGLLQIESYAFSGCRNLQKISYINPDEGKDINIISEDNSFADCPAFTQ